ncbi:MAG: diaminopimelate epimerase [Acidobacteriota bacterium]
MRVPFTKAHGAHNDFLLTWKQQLPAGAEVTPELAVAICARNVGVGADGWMLVSKTDPEVADARIELWNSDGSRSEISGNGTRCAAALLVSEGVVGSEIGQAIRIETGAGVKTLKLLEKDAARFGFEMNMGRAVVEDLHSSIVPGKETVILNVGNPQCAVFTTSFDFDWRELGAQLERHPHFPNRTNVSFIRVTDDHTLDVRFYERGAGETMSSGTGSTGAVAAAMARGLVSSPVRVLTPAGPLEIRVQVGETGDEFLLAGPAEMVASGEFYYDRK